MIEKYEVQARSRRRKASVVKKRRSTKRRSTKRRSAKKRRSTKRRSPKRRSRFGANETLLEKINNIANAKVANADENDDEVEVPVTSTRTRDSLSKQRILNAEKRVENAETEVMEANKALAKANEALAKANEALAEANEAPPPPPPLPPLPPPIAEPAAAEPVRRVSNWPTPGVRSEPVPPPIERAGTKLEGVPGKTLSEIRAAEGSAKMEKIDEKILLAIKKWYEENPDGTLTFGVFFKIAATISDTSVGSLNKLVGQNKIIVRKPTTQLGKYNTKTRQNNPDETIYDYLTPTFLLLQGIDDNVEIKLTAKAK